MAKKVKNKTKKVPSERTDAPLNRPKGPISKAEMEKALCTNGLYDVLDQWEHDIYFYAEGSDVTDTIKAVNEKIGEDIYYSKLLVMTLLAGSAKTIEPGILDRIVTLFCDNFPALRVAAAHFHPMKRIELNALTAGLYVQLKNADLDPAGFLEHLLARIPKEEWNKVSETMGKEPLNIPLLVAMKAVELDIQGAQWAFLQALGPGFDARLLRNNEAIRGDFRFVFNRVLDRNSMYSDMMCAYIPYLGSVGETVADPDVQDDVLFWLTSRFFDYLQGNLSLDEPVVTGVVEAILAISRTLKPNLRVADRFPAKVWEQLSEVVNGNRMSPELKDYFKGLMNQDGPRGQTAQNIENDIEAQLSTLRSSSAPNERFFAVDRLLTILSVNIVPLSPHIRDKALDGAMVELDKETDRLVRNALVNLVLAAGGAKHIKALTGVLKAHLDDPSWKALTDTSVATENFGQPTFKDFPTRTFAMVTLVSKGITMEKDQDILALSEKLLPEEDPDIKCLCFGYLLAITDGDRFKDVVLELMRSAIPFRAFVGPNSHELLGPGQIGGGVEFEIKQSEVEGLISFLKSKYQEVEPEAKARIRFILLQKPSNEFLPLLIEDYRYREEDKEANLRRFWLHLNFLGADVKSWKQAIPEKDKDFVRAYTQVRTEAVFNDPYARDRIGLVNLLTTLKAMGLKVPLKNLLESITNGYLTFTDIEPYLGLLKEGDWDIFFNDTINLFNSSKDGDAYKLTTVISMFCPYVRQNLTDWYKGKWESIMRQFILPLSWNYNFAQYWTEDDKDILLFWLKEDKGSDNWPLYIRLLCMVSDPKFIVKKVAPVIVEDWHSAALDAINDFDRLEEPFDIVSRDEAFAQLYDYIWKKTPEAKKSLMERWWSTEHMADTLKNRKKPKKGEIFEPEHIIKAGLEGLSGALLKWFQESRLDLSKPMAGSGPLVDVLKKIMAEDNSDDTMISSLSVFCSITGGMDAFLELAVPFTKKCKDVHASGRDLSGERFFNYSTDPTDPTLPTLLIKALELGHLDVLKPLLELMDAGIITGADELTGPDKTYGPLIDLIDKSSKDPLAVAKMLECHQEIQIAYIMRLRKERVSPSGNAKRPRPEDFGATPIEYLL